MAHQHATYHRPDVVPSRRPRGGRLSPAAYLAASACAVVYMTGCSAFTPAERTSMLDQTRRESVAESTTASVVTASKVVPPTVTITQTGRDGASVKVETPAAIREHTATNTTAATNADTRENASALDAITIPLYVKVIGLAVGLGLLIAVIGAGFWLLRRSSAAVDAAWKEANAMVANRIHNLRSRARTETDPKVILALTAEEAELQRIATEMLKD